MFVKTRRDGFLFSAVNTFIITLFSLIVIFPFWYILSTSITEYDTFSAKNGLILYPQNISLSNYIHILGNGGLFLTAYTNTIINTLFGTIIGVMITSFAAYALSEKKLPGRKPLILYFLITMFFNGGMIPTYITIKNLNLYDTRIVLILVLCFLVYHLVIMKSFFENIPDSLKESAMIDGATEPVILFKIVIPLSMPVLATISLFTIVIFWNDFFHAMLYVSDPLKQPIQLVLRNIMASSALPPEMLADAKHTTPPIIGIQTASIVIVAFPMMILYPFLQKYFEKGILIGAVKG